MRILISLILLAFAKQSVADKNCNSFATCGECIGYGAEKCVWCSEPNITTSRCRSEIILKNDRWCKREYIYNPIMYSKNIIKDEVFRLGTGNLSTIQIRPQEIHLKMRPGAVVSFQMSYQPAKDFPLDIYYLMDFTYTMRSHVAELRNQVTFIYKEMSKFTNNVRFGFGSFIEKPDFPLVDPDIHYAYSFRNHLSLTSNMSIFKKGIENVSTGGNFDGPEAGLDALMQVMACSEELGWRPEARRIIILCTDSTYHSAGDGKVVGAEKPNDMACHLNKTMFYDHSLILDYPSVGQINKMATDGNYIIIFAAVGKSLISYKELAWQIKGAKSVELKKNSNIFDIIKSTYLESVRHVTMKYQWPPYVQFRLVPGCTIDNRCEIGHKKSITMNAEVKVNFCAGSATKDVLSISPTVGGLADKLTIKLEVDCQCECEKDNSGIKKSSMCSKVGTYQCGICKCDSGRSGNICQCDEDVTSTINLDECKQDKNSTSFCNRKGECVCGKCKCNTGFSGDFCEFDDNSCKRSDDKLCSDNGKCTHGACECGAYWSGDDCSCSTHNYECFAPYSDEICSGNGDCICNECVCNKIKGKNETYRGAFCDDCEECAVKRCKELDDYAYCNYQFNKTYCDQQFDKRSNTDVLLLNKTEITTSKWTTAKWCKKILDDDKAVVFLHIYDKSSKKLLLIIQKETELLPKANIWVSVGIAIFTVILTGLLAVLIWKILVDIMDEKEYMKFEAEAKAAGFDVSVSNNPIYQPASVNFTNPTFNGTENTLMDCTR